MRDYWVSSLVKIAEPILSDFLGDKHNMPRRNIKDGRNVCYLEALGRTVCGIAPWLEVNLPDGKEKNLQKKCILMAQNAIKNATDPSHPLFIDFGEDCQNVVDAAFLAQGILRAPKVLWNDFDEITKKNIIDCMKVQRKFKPGYCNWLCFSAIIEIFLQFAGEPTWDAMRVDYAVKTHETWYKGDGFYGDGPEFHLDYYNSFVIHPMLIDILRNDKSNGWEKYNGIMPEYASKFAHHLEELIMPDGTYPILGRSSCYRYGAFHALAQAMLLEDKSFSFGAVRCAMDALIRKTQSAPDMFDDNGFLNIGIYGYQPQYANSYINTGSLYLCTTVFLPLGLSPDAEFWTAPCEEWTQKKIWN